MLLQKLENKIKIKQNRHIKKVKANDDIWDLMDDFIPSKNKPRLIKNDNTEQMKIQRTVDSINIINRQLISKSFEELFEKNSLLKEKYILRTKMNPKYNLEKESNYTKTKYKTPKIIDKKPS